MGCRSKGGMYFFDEGARFARRLAAWCAWYCFSALVGTTSRPCLVVMQFMSQGARKDSMLSVLG